MMRNVRRQPPQPPPQLLAPRARNRARGRGHACRRAELQRDRHLRGQRRWQRQHRHGRGHHDHHPQFRQFGHQLDPYGQCAGPAATSSFRTAAPRRFSPRATTLRSSTTSMTAEPHPRRRDEWHDPGARRRPLSAVPSISMRQADSCSVEPASSASAPWGSRRCRSAMRASPARATTALARLPSARRPTRAPRSP